MAYFPLIGALVGFWAAAIYDALATSLKLPPLLAAAVSSGGTLWLTGCFHEDGLCDTLDGFGGGWTKHQILRIMKDSRSGSYATIGASFWALAKCAAIAHLAQHNRTSSTSSWAFGASLGPGPAIVVAQAVARATAAPLIYACEYIVDDEDAKGEYYNWFGESRRLLGFWRVFVAASAAAAVSFLILEPFSATVALAAGAIATSLSGTYGNSIIGGVMGDFLGATICITEVMIYIALGADLPTNMAIAWPKDGISEAVKVCFTGEWGPLFWLGVVLALPQSYALWHRRSL